jgi:hypothetical protein
MADIDFDITRFENLIRFDRDRPSKIDNSVAVGATPRHTTVSILIKIEHLETKYENA